MTDELLIKFLLEEASEEERIVVQQWLRIPANQAYYTQFEKIWNAGRALASRSGIDEEQAWVRFKEKADAGTVKTLMHPVRQTFGWLKIAAVLLILAGTWAVYNLVNSNSYTDLAARNQVITKQLPDGSELTLNKNAQVSYATDFRNHRNIRLTEGDVFFSVAHDKSRPFVIRAGDVSVTVVGTSFNVKHTKQQTEVIVETGIVRVRLGKAEVKLYKGEKIFITDESSTLVKEQNTDQLYNYYRSKVFVANNTPLWKLTEVLNEAYGSEVIIQDSSIRDKTITTTLKKEYTLDDNLKTICETLNLKTSSNGKQILLSKK